MCSACGACMAVCPAMAIAFHKSSVGRVFAIAGTNCVNCGLCLKVCPSNTISEDYEPFFRLDKARIVVGKATDENVQLNGQSGGAVTAVLTYLFKSHKIDAALLCMPVADGKGKAIVVTHESQLHLCQKSIYTPVTLLKDINLILSYTSVAVVGLPCHIAGIDNLIKYKNIPITYKLGLICDRNMCEIMSDSLRDYLGYNCTDELIIKWRDKSARGYSYHNAPISVSHQDSQPIVIPSQVRQGLKSYFTPPRCLVCPDKLNVYADLAFGDPWNIHNNDTKGESLIIANNYNGCHLLQDVIANDYIRVADATGDQLNRSQHILERKAQVVLYSRQLSMLYNNDSCLLRPPVTAMVSIKELCRALYIVVRFHILELLPKKWILDYFVKKIKHLCNER